jgi:hypothetical protein
MLRRNGVFTKPLMEVFDQVETKDAVLRLFYTIKDKHSKVKKTTI